MRKRRPKQEYHPYQPKEIIPAKPEHIINSQVPLLDRILTELSVNFFDSRLDFSGTPDVLNRRDHHTAFELATDMIQTQSTFQRWYSFPNQPHLGKTIERRFMTEKDLRNFRQYVTASRKSPHCYRYVMHTDETHLGDIFVIPIITRRIASQVFLDKRRGEALETMIIALDSDSGKSGKVKRSQHIIEAESGSRLTDHFLSQSYENTDDEAVYFTIITNTLVNDPEFESFFTNRANEAISVWGKMQELKERRRKR